MEVLHRRALIKTIPAEYSKGLMLDNDFEFDVSAKVHDVVLEMGKRIRHSSRIASVSQFRSMLFIICATSKAFIFKRWWKKMKKKDKSSDPCGDSQISRHWLQHFTPFQL